jgi:hypothetical protein
MVAIDPNLVLTLWTGSIVPLAGVILYYWLFRQFELRKNRHQEKKIAYKRFLRVIPATVEALVDYESLLKMKDPIPSDPQVATAFFAQVASMQSILKSRRAIDILQDATSAKPQVDAQVSREQFLNETRGKLMLELGHVLVTRMDQTDECLEDLTVFDLPESLEVALDNLVQLYGERATNTYANLIGEALGKSSDVGDIPSWLRDWNKALEELKAEIDEDLDSM